MTPNHPSQPHEKARDPVESRANLCRIRHRALAHNKTAGGHIGQRITIERIVVLVDIVAEIDRAVARDPVGDIDPGDRNPVRQIDDLEGAGGDPRIDGGAIPARRVLQNPGGEIADIVDACAAMRVETIIVREQVP
jgi:hypothetical protein